MILKSKNLILRPLKKKDLEIVRKIRFSKKVRKNFHGISRQTKKAQVAWFNQIEKKHLYYVVINKSKKILGLLNSKINLRNRNATIGWFFDLEGSNRIRIVEAVLIFLDYVFRKYNLIKMYSDVLCSNSEALNFNNKIGFKIEGKLLKHFYYYGRFVDGFFTSIYKEDFYDKNRKFINLFKCD